MKRAQAFADPLDAAAIEAALGKHRGELSIEVADRCTSTNALLLERASGGRVALLAAEEQTAGRGRRGRRWHSARGDGLTFSVARRMRRPLAELAGLSLAAGVAAARSLRECGAAEVGLKWPNDLVARGAKLGGILVETRGAAGPTLAVIGIGINWRTTAGLDERLRRAVIALDQLVVSLPPRNALVGKIAAALITALDAFEAGGLGELRAEWESLHAHAGQRIRVRLADGRVVSGEAAGISGDGALRLRTRGGVRDIHSARIVTARTTRGRFPARRAA